MSRGSRMTRAAAEKSVCLYLQRFAMNGAKVNLYTWDRSRHGVRVAEVSFSTGMAGVSYMASEPDGLSVCAAVERVIISKMENEDVDLQLEILDWFFKEER